MSTVPLSWAEDHLSDRLVIVPFSMPSIPSLPSASGKLEAVTLAPKTTFGAKGFGKEVSETCMPQSKSTVPASERRPFFPTATTFSSCLLPLALAERVTLAK